jgi:hypothetical protein
MGLVYQRIQGDQVLRRVQGDQVHPVDLVQPVAVYRVQPVAAVNHQRKVAREVLAAKLVAARVQVRLDRRRAAGPVAALLETRRTGYKPVELQENRGRGEEYK